MAGITLAQRDLPSTRARLGDWFEQKFGEPVTLSELEAANRASGWSSESLKFSAQRSDGTVDEYVVRIPPSGGGIFAEYDLLGQTRTQELLHTYGIATPSPIHYEPDDAWIGSKFLVMPRIVGHTPSDTSYATRGWLHGAGPAVQRRAHDSFLETLVGLQRVPRSEAPWLVRPTGVGNTAELTWWREYVEWGTDGQVPEAMAAAFDWLTSHQPEDTDDLVLCWGDARLSNAIFDDDGTIIGVLDWEQACWCPAEVDFAWWLGTRRQMLEVHGLNLDPELPGFDTRARLIERYQELIGRPLVDLEWYEIFAMVRMGCCIVRMQALLRSIGQGDHGFTKAPVLPAWTTAAITASD
jgi:aminoglycoside phosphotransferase (APT) family kinase protein